MTMPFGKHRGRPLDQVGENYLRWLLTLDNLSDWLRGAVEEELVARQAEDRWCRRQQATDTGDQGFEERARAATEAAARREAEGVDMEVALLIVQRGAAALRGVLEGLPEDERKVKAAKAWLEDACLRFLRVGAGR